MDNHFHLALELGAISLSRVMHLLLSSYSLQFNRRHNRVGHLFQGRYAAYLVQKEPYLGALLQYIHQNPVKARLVRQAESYRWSSARYYELGDGPDWLDINDALAMAGRVFQGRRSFDAADPAGADLLPEPQADGIVGEPDFVTSILRLGGRVPPPPPSWTVALFAEAAAAAEKLSVAELTRRSRHLRASRARTLAAFVARREAGIPVAQTARFFGRAESTLIRRVVLLEAALERDVALREKVSAVTTSVWEGTAGRHD
jgi:hypothetical protein